MNESKICRDALNVFGQDSQKMMCIEECAELVNALTKERRGRATDDDIITEIADCQIMLEQMAQLYGREKVKKERYRKLRRLEARVRKVARDTVWPHLEGMGNTYQMDMETQTHPMESGSESDRQDEKAQPSNSSL